MNASIIAGEDFPIDILDYRDALAMHRKTLGEEHPALGRNLNFLARLKFETGALDEAKQLLLQTLVLYQKTLPTAHP